MSSRKASDASPTIPPEPPTLQLELARAILRIDNGLRRPWPGDELVEVPAATWMALVAIARKASK